MKLFSSCFYPNIAVKDDADQRREKAVASTQPPSVLGDASVRNHQDRRNRSSWEHKIRQLLNPASSSQDHAPLFDITNEPADVCATIKWLEKGYYSLGDEKNGLPSKPITAQPPAGEEANGGFKASELGARLSDDNAIALHITPNGILPGRNDGLFGLYLDDSKLCPLAPKQMSAIGKLTSPHFPTSKPCLKPRVTNIDARTATHLVAARATIDLVKALLPFGAGNQVKDVVRSGGESLFRSSLAKMSSGSGRDYISHAEAAIVWKSGFCGETSALTFAILGSIPELKDAQIDWVGNFKLSHNIAIIRGDKPEHDVIVDPWTPFAVPCLSADATDLHRKVAQRPEMNQDNEILRSKRAGEVFEPLDVDGLLQKHEELPPAFKDPHVPFCAGSVTQAKRLHIYLTETTWDLLYTGNPNMRYLLEGTDGKPPIMLRFDMQRMAKNSTT